MKHEVTHDLGRDQAKQATEAAFGSNKEALSALVVAGVVFTFVGKQLAMVKVED